MLIRCWSRLWKVSCPGKRLSRRGPRRLVRRPRVEKLEDRTLL
jgi:hypothetical protein